MNRKTLSDKQDCICSWGLQELDTLHNNLCPTFQFPLCCMTHDLVYWLAVCLWFPGRPLHVFPVWAVHRAAGLRHVEHYGGVWLVHLLHCHNLLPWVSRLCQQGKQTHSNRDIQEIYTRIPLGKIYIMLETQAGVQSVMMNVFFWLERTPGYLL